MTPAIQRSGAGKEKNADRHEKWLEIKRRLQQLKVQIQQTENVLAFAFIEGSLVRAIRNGDWVLLDEINLAAAETLECLSGLLESSKGSIVLAERGDVEPIVRHPDFRLFACMNPATDVGKKDLPTGIRNRFTELYVDELEETQDLKILVSDYLKGLALSAAQLEGIVKFYLAIREEASKHLTDGTGHKPHFSLRTLCRALRYSSRNPCGQVLRSLYEGFCLSFLTQLDRASHPVVEKLVCRHILGKANIKSILNKDIPMPAGGKYHFVEGYWISVGTAKPANQDKYILTPSVRANLKDLSRVVSAGQHPVLIQGETSVGKTSLVTWLAQTTCNACVRVNNHEHTDLQEYVGSYAADQHGKLVFKEGVLVEAMRQGHWIILDELNLAPTDVLEALNRLLDDNRELFIPETQETVKAHPKFMLFATQNPPGQYAGRKMLSRAFRNRFVELHFDQIPSKELETILHRRCDLPMSYAQRLVTTMLDLQMRRRGSGVFAGKHGFMTLRDLFRWAERYKCKNVNTKGKKFYDWDQHMADHGYMLLAGRVRRAEETTLVLEVIQKHLKRTVDPVKLFTLGPKTSPTTVTLLKEVTQQTVTEFGHIVWTYNMRRLAVLIGQAIQFDEPVLLVGQTGCGKTTVCQLYAALNQTKLYNINCHLHTESADFLGGLRPCRSHDHSQNESSELKLFEWVDGPLVISMREGSMFLIDEISLADDSVLERLNSVLEPERKLLLAEKGGGSSTHDQADVVVAKEGFQVFATMNPGGDFGKKELSPALRNRFTEIWCAQTDQPQDLVDIIEHNLTSGIHLCNQEDGTSGIGRAIMDFIQWFSNNDIGKRCTVSIRDILSWVHFINTCSKTVDDETMETDEKQYNKLDPAVAFIHGACLVFLDGLGSGTTSRGKDAEVHYVRDISLKYLLQLVNQMTHQSYDLTALGLIDNGAVGHDVVITTENEFCIQPFAINRGVKQCEEGDRYALQAPTTCVNAQRILRALQLTRPLLLEGSPGVGKTSLVAAIARAAGQELVRINLSEQTDVTDLFGADLPVEGQEGGVFAWRDGPLLQALKAGHWIVLDELNLASQSVLEGLNACLDHRAEVYVPELGKTFSIQHEKTRLFACQNPLNQGGGRKGLPRSFLNRFTQVYVEPLSLADLLFISGTMYPQLPQQILTLMVHFNMQIHQETTVESQWGQKGSPWEFNLRDLFRWCDLLCHNQTEGHYNPGEYVGLLYRERLRTVKDKDRVKELYEKIFPDSLPYYTPSRHACVSDKVVQVGHSFLQCRELQTGETTVPLYLLHHLLDPLESVMKCVQMNWMSILVGPQSCGKSSLVQLLSRLTGQPLHVLAVNSAMDTTELLGGFEQADIKNHVEKLVCSTETIVREASILLLQDQHLTKAGKVQETWSDFRQLRTGLGVQLSSVEELQKIKDKVTGLGDVITTIRQTLLSLTTEEAAELLHTLSELESLVTNVTSKLALTSPGSGGGAFEWVDSVLVQALQDGHWLLIDNVNFCSASVLDRLNALLEPHGVLSINERGVIDGSIPTIKPHPNFRLFLAMDPKFGEISRAMRNRGVEIYIPGEDDGSPYTCHDTKVMLQGQGLLDTRACDWLISLHSVMRENISRGERPVILDLLHAAMLTRQQRDRGISLVKALMQASSDVYVKNVKALVTKKLAKELWEDQCRHLIGLASQAQDVVTMTTVSTGDFHSDRRLANVKIHGTTFLVLLEECKHCLRNRESPQLRSKMKQLWHAGILFVNLASGVSRQLHFDWMMSVIRCLWRELESSGVDREELSTFRDFVRQLCDSLQHLLKGTPAILPPEYGHINSWQFTDILFHGPVDPRWNPQPLHQFFLDCKQVSPYLIQFNRLHMMQAAVIRLKNSADNALLHRLETFTNKSVLGRHNHPELLDIYSLLSRKQELMDAIGSLELQDYSDVVRVLDAVTWRCRLLEACESSITGGELEYHTMALHWNWFYKRAWLLLKDSLPQQLHSVVNHLHPSFIHNDKQFVHFWTSVGYPAPFRDIDEADVTLALDALGRAIDIEVESVAMVTRKKVQLILCDGGQVMNMLKDAMIILHSEAEDSLEKCHAMLKQIQESLKTFDLDKKNMDEMDSPQSHLALTGINSAMQSSSPWQHIPLWPLFEFTALVSEVALIPQLLRGEADDTVALTDFCMTFTPVSPSQIYLYRLLTAEQKVPLNLYKRMFRKTWNCTAVKHINTWLHWTEEQAKGDNLVATFGHNDKIYGPFALHMATLTYAVFSFLSGSHHGDKKRCLGPALTSDLQCLHVPMGQCEDQAQKLAVVTKHLWSHAPLLSCHQYSPSVLERQHLVEAFMFFLKSAEAVVTPDKVQLYTGSLSTVQAGLAEGGTVTEGCLKDGLAQCQNCLQSSLTALQNRIDSCFSCMCPVLQKTSSDMADVGVAWVHLGLLQRALLVPAVSVDPVEKVSIKLQYARQELEETEAELSVYRQHHLSVTGQDLSTLADNLVHPRIPHLVATVTSLKGRVARLEQQQAYRPKPSQFKFLVSDIKNYLSSVGAEDHILQLVQRLSAVTTAPANEFAEERMWQKTQGSFLDNLDERFPLYRDLVTPFSVAVSLVRHGVRLVAGSVQQHQLRQQLIGQDAQGTEDSERSRMTILEEKILDMSKFPSISASCPSYLDLVKSLTSVDTSGLLQAVNQRAEDASDHQETHLLSRLLHAGLDLVKCDSLVRRELTSDLTLTLSLLFHRFLTAWQAQEAARKKKEKEEGSLYRYKSKVHGDDRHIDAIEEEQFRKSFPTFDKDFVDITGVDTLEESEVMESESEAEEFNQGNIDPGTITVDEMYHVSQVHERVFTSLSQAPWLPRLPAPQVDNQDVASSSLSTYCVGSVMATLTYDVLSNEVDPRIIGGHLLASRLIQEEITPSQTGDNNQTPVKQHYDIYHDSNVAEVVQCRPVLSRLTIRVQELLAEWPDHPTLRQLMKIMERLLTFPVTSPVVKFLSGLELLLEKAQEWESNAARHVSIATQLADVSLLILQWRKLELGCWSECLESVWRQHKCRASKWWFYLYQLLMAFVQTGAQTQTDEGTSQAEVLRSLKQFMESATLGDYKTRLGMLRAFHCQLVVMETSPNQDTLLSFLWNLHQFYSQFTDLVQGELDKLRSPIQKELKGFVKISRWTDMNYWALKQTTEKTHRTLHKHMKAFQAILEQPIGGILKETSTEIATSSDSLPSSWLTQLTDAVSGICFTTLGGVTELPQFVVEELFPLQCRLPVLCQKACKHLTTYVSSTQYSDHIRSVDEATGDIIETVHELQALEVNQNADKDKQKSEAKHIHQKKRKALADLFKYLAFAGLSYRKGLVLMNKETDEDRPLLVPPMDVSALVQQLPDNQSNATLSALGEGCIQYYYRCMARRARLMSALNTPSKELGVGNIDRCKGFTEHLVDTMICQYRSLAHISKGYKHLSTMTSSLSKLQDDVYRPQPPVLDLCDWTTKLKDLLVTVREGVAQFEMLLDCCPHPTNGPAPHPSPFPRSQLSVMALMTHGDDLWTEASDKVKNIKDGAKELQDKLLRLTEGSSILTWSDLAVVSSVVKDLIKIVPDLESIEEGFHPPGSTDSCSLTDTLAFLRQHIDQTCSQFLEWQSRCESLACCEEVTVVTPNTREFGSRVEGLVTSLLLVIQTLTKSHASDESSQTNKKDDEDDDDSQEGHFIRLLCNKIGEDNVSINFDKITGELDAMLHQLTSLWDTAAGRECSVPCGQMLVRCLPLLHQYLSLVRHNFLHQLAVTRTTGKLLSTLLGVFTELASKGFCLPAEFADEIAGEGATEFVDIEGGGMGEGEGAKDVSDQIETEDQLEDTRKQHEKKEEENQPDVESEENAIEMSEDFDANVQDLEDADKKSDDEENDNEDDDEDKLDKQMGDVDEDDADKLDEQMWGSDEEEEENDKEDKKEESGPGAGQEQESHLVAKDDNTDKGDGDDDEKEEKNEDTTAEDKEDVKPHQQEEIDESEYDDDRVDPHHGNQDQEEQPEMMDLPDDLKLDEDEADTEEKTDGQDEDMSKSDDKVEEMDDKEETTPEEQEEEEEESKDDDKSEEKSKEEKDEKDEEGFKESNTQDEMAEDDVTPEDREEEKGEDTPGFSAQEDKPDVAEESEEKTEEKEDDPQTNEQHGKTSHGVEDVEQSDRAQDEAGKSQNDQQQSDNVGTTSTEQLEGHEGQSSSKVTHGAAQQNNAKPLKRKPGQSDTDRSLGSTEQNYKRLKTVDGVSLDEESEENKMESDLYQHIKDARSHDAQTLDTATDDQLQQQALPNKDEEESEAPQQDDDVEMQEDDDDQTEQEAMQKMSKLKGRKEESSDGREKEKDEVDMETEDSILQEVSGEVVMTTMAARGPDSTIHTVEEHLYVPTNDLDIEQLRCELEQQLVTWSDTSSLQQESLAAEAWHKYEALTTSLSQELCEQLRLVLEPSQATKLRGDYRTGKRLNMRKVIPYIASQFRKDKIWLRRTKPSKRQYQIMLAIDDSSSMVDNHSKQLAYESLALIANALTLLESGELGICSFGESVRLLHPFTEQFTTQSGAKLLQHFTFEQKKTKIAQLLKQMTSLMVDARARQHGMLGNPDTSQLLLIVSDGRGLFMEGMETVKSAVRQAREARLFLVFVIIDNPENKDSILDIRVPVFKDPGQMPEIKSYMDHFPFPFYIILRDINSLPHVLCDALRQWFELVTATDR